MQDPLDPGTKDLFAKRTGNRTRQQTWRAKMEAEGFVQVNVWVHQHQAGGLQVLAHALRQDRGLEAGPARDAVTRRFRSVER